MKAFLPKTGIFTVVFLIANLFFVSSSFGQNTGLLAPTTSANINSVTNVTNGLTSNNAYAIFDSSNDVGDYGGFFNVSIPAGATILGIEVQLEGNRANTRNLEIQLTWNNKSTFTALKTMPSFTNTDDLRIVGSPTDTWGRTWTVSELTNANFFVRLDATFASGNLNLDQVLLKIYYCLSPTISTTGTATDVCFSTGSQTTTLNYTATTNNPESYSITWAGMANQGSTAFAFSAGGGTITGITIPPSTGTGTYNGTLTITNAEGCSVSNPISVVVNVLPTANAGSPLSAICQDGTSVQLGGSVGGSATSGAWSDGGVGGTFNPSDTDLNATWTPPSGYSGTAILTLTTSGGACGTTTASKSQVVNAPPTASVTPPISPATVNKSICSSQTATVEALEATASIGDTILWIIDQTTLYTGGGFITNSDSLTPTYHPAVADEGHTVTLKMTVSNSCIATATANYTVAVNGTARVDAGADQVICVTSPVVSLGGSIDGSAYRGTWSGGGGTIVQDPLNDYNMQIANSNFPTYTPSPTEISNGGDVILTLTTTDDSFGSPCGVPVTDTMKITILKETTAQTGISGFPITQSICSGESATVSGALASVGDAIEWTIDQTTAYTGQGSISDATSLTPTYTSVAGDSGQTVTLKMTVSNDACPSATATYTIVVNPLPINRSLLGTAPICSGTTATIQVDNSEFGIQYQLINDLDEQPTGGPVAGTGGVIDLQTNPLTTNTTVKVLATNLTTNCSVEMTGTIVISVNPAPVNRTFAVAATPICAGTETNITAVSITPATPLTTYELRKSTDLNTVISTVTGNTGGAISSPNFATGNLSTTTTFNVLARIEATQCTAQMTVTPTVTVNPVISNNTISADQSICNAAAPETLIGSTPTGGNGSYNYLWQQSTDDFVTNTASASTANSLNTTKSYTPPQNLAQTMWYRRVVTSGPAAPAVNQCNDISPAVKITVIPLPAVYSVTGGGAYCVGGTGMPVGLSNSQANVNYQLYLNGSPDGSPVVGTGAAIDFGNKTVEGTYTVVAKDILAIGNDCISNMNGSATIIISPVPSTVGASVCIGESGELTSPTVCPREAPITTPAANASSAANVGTVAWQGPTDIFTDNGNPATVNNPTNTVITSGSLQGKNYGFEIPADAEIKGITVFVNRYFSGNGSAQDNSVRLIKGGIITGTEKAVSGNWSTTTSTVVSYGGNAELWGESWTPADINNPNFGVALKANVVGFNSTFDGDANVDYMQITVTYALNGSIKWYTTTTGGTSIGTGSPFNPVGVAGSGLPDTNTPGTTTFYAECSSVEGCRTPADFVVNPLPIMTCPANSAVCIDTALYALTEASPAGGTYSGMGVSDNNFNPAIAGVGPHIITYSYTDSNGCTNTCTFTITVNPAVVASGTPTNVLCNGASTGAIDLNVTGGSGSYTYLWSNNETTQDVSGLAASVTPYSVIITESNGCTISGTTSFTITEPAAVVASGTQVDVLCKGASTGSIDLSVTGGSDSYTYLWSNGEITQDISGLPAGTYSVIITESNGCAVTGDISFTIAEPTIGLVATITSPHTDVDCFGNQTGSATVEVTGGTLPYAYLWNDGASQTTATAINLAAGNYTVTVTDANGNGCISTAAVTITEPAVLEANIPVQTNVGCFGANTGSATVEVTGGTEPYEYLWNDGSAQITATASGLEAGEYMVTITDANGCVTTATVTITEPAATVATGTQDNVLCNGAADGSIDLSVSGGSGLYTYEWSNGATTQDIVGLLAGTYSVTVTDTGGCTVTGTTSFTITQPDAVVASGTQVDVLCKGASTGSIDLSVTGGSDSYTYLWSNGEITQDISGLVAGTYSVVITESNGCAVTGNTSFMIVEPAIALATTITSPHTDVDCFGNQTGSATVEVIGGTLPYTYSWNDGGSQNTATATNLAAGEYTVTVTDANGNGCVSSATVIITEPEVLAASITSQTNVGCFGTNTGSATVGTTGGTEPYEYLWNDGLAQITATANNLEVGDYMVTITDANGCTTTATVSITESDATVATGTQDNVLCNGGADGAIDLSVSGGSGSYTYLWSNGEITQDISGLEAGSYSVTVTDTGGCAVAGTTSFVITEPDAVVANGTQIDVFCNGASTGSIDLSVTGGSGSYTYLWGNGETTQDISGLPAGTYSVTITESNGCTVVGITSFTITESILLTASITAQTDVDCFGNSNGSATVTASGGASPYSYSWDNGGILDTTSGLSVGDYTVTVTDDNGCTTTATANINVDDNIIPTVITQNIEVELSPTSVSITVSDIDNGSNDNCGIQSMTVSPSSFTCANIGSNIVTLTVTDTNGNVNSATATVTVKDVIAPAIIGMPTNKIVNVSGGNCSSLVSWTAPTATDNCGMESLLSSDETYNENGSTLLGIGEHTITYTATDVNGNITTASFTVTVVDQIAPTITNCPANITVNTDNNICGARVFYIQPNVNDCNGATLNINSNSYLSGNIFPAGPPTTVIWTAIDESGNHSSCSFTVTVIDNQAPVANVASLPTITAECSITVATPTASDNCDGNISGVPDVSTTFNTPGSHTINWTYEDINGNESYQSQTVNITATPPVINTQPVSLAKCEGQSATFSVSSSAIGYQWQVNTGGGGWVDVDFETSSSLNIPSVTPDMNGNQYRVIINGSCGSTTSNEVVLTVDSLPSISDLANQNLCNTSSFALAQSPLTVGTGLWTLISGSASITNVNSPNTDVTGVAVGTSAKVRWTVTNGSCSVYDEVTVTNTILPSVSNQPDQALCNMSSFTMTQSIPSAGTGVWTLEAGSAIITTPNSPTTTVTGVTTSATLRWTVTNVNCSSYDDVIVTNTTLDPVSDQANQTLCNTSSFTMTQSAPSIGSGTWSIINGSANITSPSSPVTTVTGLATGTSATLRWTVTSGSCTAYDDVTVTNTSLPSVSNQPDQTLCNTSSFTMTQSGSGSWSLISGNAAVTITTISSPTTTITGVPVGTSATVRWTVGSGSCTAYDDVTVTNNSTPPTVSNQPDQTLCNTSSFTMTQTGSGTWTKLSGTGTITTPGSPVTTITGVSVGTSTTVRWTVSSGACTAYDDVIVTNNAASSFAASIASSSPDAFCSGLVLTVNPSVAGSYSYLWSPGGATTPSITLYNSSSAGTYTVTVSQSGGCGGTAQASYNFQPQNVINDYTILGFTDVNLGDKNFVQTGSVGVTRPLGYAKIGMNSTVAGPGGFVKARFITVGSMSNVPTRIYSPVTVTLPNMQVNSTSTTGLSDLSIPNNTTVTKTGNYKNVTIGTNCNVTFTTGTIFGSVTIGRSSQVKFNANNTGVLNVNSINMADGTDASPTKLLFASNIAVRVKTAVNVGKSSLVNPTGGYKAVFYIGGSEFRVMPGGNVTVNASIFAPNGTIRVEGDAVKNTYMKGFNIASRVVSTNKNIYWNQFDCLNPSAKTIDVENVVAKEIDPVRPEVALFDVKAYPNPSNYQFTLELEGGNADKIEIEVYDMQGRHIKHIESEYDLPIVFGEELPAGTYLTIVNQGSNRKALKLIKK